MTPTTHMGRALAELRDARAHLDAMGESLRWPTPIAEAYRAIRNAMEHVEQIDDADRATHYCDEVCNECGGLPDVLDDCGRPLCADHYRVWCERDDELRRELGELEARP